MVYNNMEILKFIKYDKMGWINDARNPSYLRGGWGLQKLVKWEACEIYYKNGGDSVIRGNAWFFCSWIQCWCSYTLIIS